MGLDNYVHEKFITPELLKDLEEAKLNLVGGMFSGNGVDGSFRGKCYDGAVQAVTNSETSLYNEYIDPDMVKFIASCLSNIWEDEEEMKDARLGLADWFEEDEIEEQLRMLTKYFEICAKHEVMLIGWW